MPDPNIYISRSFFKEVMPKIDEISRLTDDIDTLIFKLIRLRQISEALKKACHEATLQD